jgi:hypothetical protein
MKLKAEYIRLPFSSEYIYLSICYLETWKSEYTKPTILLFYTNAEPDLWTWGKIERDGGQVPRKNI